MKFKRVIATFLTLACTLSLTKTVEAKAPVNPEPCLSESEVGTNLPVILVHGLFSKGAAWGDENDKDSMLRIIKTMPGIYVDKPFDYSANDQNWKWVSDDDIGPKLAERINCVAIASLRAGGLGKVVVIGHSMGGLAIRFAANEKHADGGLIADRIALAITIATPHEGSGWANIIKPYCWHARAVNVSDDNPCAQYALEGLQSRSAQIESLPWIPSNVPVLQLAGNVRLTTTAFDDHVVKETNSDLVVSMKSALQHGPHKRFESSKPSTTECKMGLTELQTIPVRNAFGWMPNCWHSALVRNGYIKEQVQTAINRYVSTTPLSFAREWGVRGSSLVVKMDGTGTSTWNHGPCNPSAPFDKLVICQGHAEFDFTVDNAGVLHGRYTKEWYTARFEGQELPPNSNPRPFLEGKTFELRHTDDPHVLISASRDHDDGPGNPYLCDNIAQASGALNYQFCQ